MQGRIHGALATLVRAVARAKMKGGGRRMWTYRKSTSTKTPTPTPSTRLASSARLIPTSTACSLCHHMAPLPYSQSGASIVVLSTVGSTRLSDRLACSPPASPIVSLIAICAPERLVRQPANATRTRASQCVVDMRQQTTLPLHVATQHGTRVALMNPPGH